jgi:hypothetical protein
MSKPPERLSIVVVRPEGCSDTVAARIVVGSENDIDAPHLLNAFIMNWYETPSSTSWVILYHLRS